MFKSNNQFAFLNSTQLNTILNIFKLIDIGQLNLGSSSIEATFGSGFHLRLKLTKYVPGTKLNYLIIITIGNSVKPLVIDQTSQTFTKLFDFLKKYENWQGRKM